MRNPIKLQKGPLCPLFRVLDKPILSVARLSSGFNARLQGLRLSLLGVGFRVQDLGFRV